MTMSVAVLDPISPSAWNKNHWRVSHRLGLLVLNQ